MHLGFFIVLLCICKPNFAQDNTYLSLSSTPGFLLAHRADLKNLAAHNYGFDISFEKEKENSSWGSKL